MLFGLLLALGTACDLLQPKEIAAVQGEAPTAAKPSNSREGALDVRRCFFSLPKFDQSVSLEVRTGAADDVLESWKKMESKEEKEKEGEKEGPGGKEVSGVGREALWLGDKRSGALWVRAETAIVRISLGGGATAEAKIKSSKKLARRILRRLSKQQ